MVRAIVSPPSFIDRLASHYSGNLPGHRLSFAITLLHGIEGTGQKVLEVLDLLKALINSRELLFQDIPGREGPHCVFWGALSDKLSLCGLEQVVKGLARRNVATEGMYNWR